MNPLFSIILPTYNRKLELARSLNSIKASHFDDYEIIVVDDGSTDGTAELISEKFKDIVYIYQKNQGVSSARNTGIANATGKLLAFMDSDDTWYPERLSVLSGILELLPSEVGLIFNDMDKLIKGHGDGVSYSDKYFGVKKRRLYNGMIRRITWQYNGKEFRISYGDVFADLLYGNVIQPSCAVVKQEVFHRLGGFREDFRVANDSELFLRVSRHYKIAYVPMIFTSLEPPRSDISLSLPINSIEKIENTITIIRDYYREEKRGILKRRLKGRWSELHKLLGYHYLSDYRRQGARACYKRSIQLDPVQIKAYLMYFLTMAPCCLLQLLLKTKRVLKVHSGF